mmetsp:Transcript_27886/g.43084  ORF Transcript_27886/g.43084 Transcript_27886/m.43084 type:complete len:443 (+) Transcript_27886:84-1412(+)
MWSESIPTAAATLFSFVSYSSNRRFQQVTTHSGLTRCSTSSSSCPISASENTNDDISQIRRGQLYIEHDFLTPSELQALRDDIAQLRRADKFQPSGLSNRVKGDPNLFGISDRWTCTITTDLWEGNRQYSSMRLLLEEKLEDLKSNLELLLSPPKHNGTLELHLAEMYYSISPKGSCLPRHQDERHEETKGDKGWINDTRRSISWILYLNDNWASHDDDSSALMAGSGGELRAFCRNGGWCGSSDGNLQVGWLRKDINATNQHVLDFEFDPIFLDSWVKVETCVGGKYHEESDENGATKWRPMSALYRIKNKKGNRSTEMRRNGRAGYEFHRQDPQREYLSQPFGPDSPTWPSQLNLEPLEFAKALALQLSNKEFRDNFIGTEDISAPGIDIIDVSPYAGTLVLFDSVVVPHEVLEVKGGQRLAVAGWFHEDQQAFPDWYGT